MLIFKSASEILHYESASEQTLKLKTLPFKIFKIKALYLNTYEDTVHEGSVILTKNLRISMSVVHLF